MDLQAVLAAFSPEQVELLKAALLSDNGRSPIKPRQLHDLRTLPSATNPRPTFFWSAKSPDDAGDLTKTQPYPRLMWEIPSGREITVADAKAEATYTAQGFILTPPANAEKPSPFDALRDMLEGLSEADRQLVLKGAHATRLDRMKEGILGLSDEEREALIAALMPDQKRKSA
jgi:hypothetical protein